MAKATTKAEQTAEAVEAAKAALATAEEGLTQARDRLTAANDAKAALHDNARNGDSSITAEDVLKADAEVQLADNGVEFAEGEVRRKRAGWEQAEVDHACYLALDELSPRSKSALEKDRERGIELIRQGIEIVGAAAAEAPLLAQEIGQRLSDAGAEPRTRLPGGLEYYTRQHVSDAGHVSRRSGTYAVRLNGEWLGSAFETVGTGNERPEQYVESQINNAIDQAKHTAKHPLVAKLKATLAKSRAKASKANSAEHAGRSKLYHAAERRRVGDGSWIEYGYSSEEVAEYMQQHGWNI